MKSNNLKPIRPCSSTLICCALNSTLSIESTFITTCLKKLLWIFIFTFMPFAFSQNQKVDSLSILLQNEKDNQIKLNLLSELVTEQSQTDIEKAIVYARQGVAIAENTKNQQWQPKFYEMQGRIHANLLELDSASYYFNKALSGYKTIKDKRGQATTYFKIGWIYKRKGDIEQALKVDLEALTLMEEIDDKIGIAGAYSRISEDLNKQERHHEALEYALKTIDLSNEYELKNELVYAFTSAGDINIAMGNNQEAFNYYDKALNLAKVQEFSIYDVLNFTNNRANALKRMGKYQEAKKEYKSSLLKAKEVNYENAIYVITANLGEVNLLLGNYEDALKYQLQTVALQEANNDLSNLTENYDHVSSIYEKLGNYPKALEYQKKARVMRDSTAAIESDKVMSNLLTKYETAKKEETIKNQEAKISQQQKTQILYISIAALLTFSLIGMFSSMKTIRKKRKKLQVLNLELESKNKQNELLLKEIHHRVKNNLELVKSLISLQSAQLEDSATKDAMIASQNRVQSMGIIHQKLYQGQNLGSIEMRDYFNNLSEGVLDTFDREDQVKIECAMDQLELDVDTAVPIGLIVNELLTNALKYAFPENQKGNIQISLLKDKPDILTLKVIDNGVGKIEGASPNGTGFGSQLIKLLTQQLNGKMEENNTNGTSVLFHFKLKHAA
ncbi:tetratricopeptide repeat protein [Xanthomarina sp. F2636L]|uniref:tetratricopeptide repeat-containing sensor histidine kinase n=1 Tax=Xanthomarina sp. F2636L TaxID=2996018 RepID=UPI00225DE77A|nr:tetratricopeptide repeat protein [Xanthomarina sp. F2636L]MCX7550499.1 tetratricopeptide repeat protein [Xanthomarina sp. F2636L]